MPILHRVSLQLSPIIFVGSTSTSTKASLSTGPHAFSIPSRTTSAFCIRSISFGGQPVPVWITAVSRPGIASLRHPASCRARARARTSSSTSTTTRATSAKMVSFSEASQGVRVLIAGGCYAGLATAANLLDLSNGLTPRQSGEAYPHHPDLPRFDVDITIVDERDGYYHLIGTPLAFADSEYASKNWVKYADLAGLKFPNVKFIQGAVSSVDPETKQATVTRHITKEETVHEYDYFVAGTGLRRVFPVVPQSLTRKQYLVEAEAQIQACEKAKHGVVIVGGGAVGIEMAAELKMVKPHVKVTLVHSRDKLLSSEGLPDETKDVALELLKESGVEVLMGHRLANTKKIETEDDSHKQELEFTNGNKMFASEVFMAVSKSVPSTTFIPAVNLDSEGYVNIRPNLNFESGPNADFHFAAGDITKWSGIKRCGAAMHHGHYVAMNLHQRLIEERTGTKPSFFELREVPAMIGLAVGKKAVAYGPDAGTISGEDVCHAYFRDDLGWGICWNWMGLGGRKDQAKV